MQPYRTERLVGWIAVAVSTLFISLWAFWGTIENFHEGWYQQTLSANLALLFGQYLIAMIVFWAFALVGLKWPRIGAAVHVIFGCSLPVWFIRNNTGAWLLTLPMIALGIMYWFGDPQPKKWAYRAVILIPLVVLIVSGAEPAWRVAHRFDDGNLGMRELQGNGIRLFWAPKGPGWPDDGVTWQEAKDICSRLSFDGLSLADSAVNIWHLPSTDELVRSATRHNVNCQGKLDTSSNQPDYASMPDKEPPLWDIHSKIIYWWTSTEKTDSTAYIFVYNGALYPRLKKLRPGYLGFRAVRPATEK
jgi:hypothetical protein